MVAGLDLVCIILVDDLVCGTSWLTWVIKNVDSLTLSLKVDQSSRLKQDGGKVCDRCNGKNMSQGISIGHSNRFMGRAPLKRKESITYRRSPCRQT